MRASWTCRNEALIGEAERWRSVKDRAKKMECLRVQTCRQDVASQFRRSALDARHGIENALGKTSKTEQPSRDHNCAVVSYHLSNEPVHREHDGLESNELHSLDIRIV